MEVFKTVCGVVFLLALGWIWGSLTPLFFPPLISVIVSLAGGYSIGLFGFNILMRNSQ